MSRDDTALAPTTRALLANPEAAAGELTARFPRDLANPVAAREFVAVAWTYDLDPFMGDVVPYQGRPFVTEQGWLRLIGRHAPGQLVKLNSRQADKREREEINCPPADFLAIAEVRRSYPAADGGGALDVCRRGRVTKGEASGQGIAPDKRGHRPIEVEPYEMAETRARRRALRTAFRDVLTAQGMPIVNEETGEIIEGVAVTLPDAGKSPDPAPAARLSEEANRARGELFKRAEEMRIVAKADLHRALKLTCKGEPAAAHAETNGPGECHKLRESIDYLQRQGKTEPEAWEIMRERLVSNGHGQQVERGARQELARGQAEAIDRELAADADDGTEAEPAGEQVPFEGEPPEGAQ